VKTDVEFSEESMKKAFRGIDQNIVAIDKALEMLFNFRGEHLVKVKQIDR
jgi:hypothetical protein